MKQVVIDSNIIFAALRSNNAAFREFLSNPSYRFFTANFLIAEIFKHKERILRNSKAGEEDTFEYLNKILQKLNFVNEEFISTANLIHAYRLCNDIDPKDTPFVALALELECKLWTKDLEIKQGLLKKGFDNFFDDTLS